MSRFLKPPRRKRYTEELRDVYAEYYKIRLGEPEKEKGKEILGRYKGKRGGSR